MRPALHLPNQQNAVFDADTSAQGLEERAEHARTTLMDFFNYNRDHEDGRHLLYHESPSHYVFLKKEGVWKPRQRDFDWTDL